MFRLARSSSPDERHLRVGVRAALGVVPWFDALVIAWLLLLYDAINNLAPLQRAVALRRAADVLSLERKLHIDIELTLNRWLAHEPLLGYIAGTYYDLGHVFVTFGVLGVMWWKRRDLYKSMRSQLVLVNLVAFIVFWRFPVAPPRMLANLGFSDIVAKSDALVSWHTGRLARDANQYAAMPSLHVAWAMWSARAIWRMVPRRSVRGLAVVMPFLTALVVIATANHFVLDVVSGAATFLLAGVTVPSMRRLAHRSAARLTATTRLGATLRESRAGQLTRRQAAR